VKPPGPLWQPVGVPEPGGRLPADRATPVGAPDAATAGAGAAVAAPAPRRAPAGAAATPRSGSGEAPASTPSRPSERPGARDLPGWDGLRALAATGVLVLHATYMRLPPRGDALAVVAQFQAGVQVFFVISAFLLSRPYLHGLLDPAPGPAPWPYARRRLLRVYPAYWVALVAAVLLGQHSFHGLRDWGAQLGLLHVYRAGPFGRGLGVAWTLSVEISFYLFLPLFFLVVGRAARRFGPRRSLGTGLALVFACGVAFAAWVQATDRQLLTFWLPFHLPVFAGGIAMAWAAVESGTNDGLRALADRVGRLAALWWTLAGLVLLLAAADLGRSVVLTRYRAGAAQVYWGVAALLIALPVAFGFRRRGVGRLLELRWVKFVGLVSYGVYLWHPQLVTLIADDWLGWPSRSGNPWALAVAVFAASVAVGAASWYAVERPVIRLGSRR